MFGHFSTLCMKRFKCFNFFYIVRDDDGFDSEGEEQSKKIILQKFDSEEYIDLLSLLLKHADTDSGTLLHYATRVS